MPTDEDTYILDTDESHHDIGAMLSQVQTGEERVIIYATGRTTMLRGSTAAPSVKNF